MTEHEKRIDVHTPARCQELLEWMSEYVDGNIDPKICKEFEEHLSGCSPCQVVVNTMKKTITIYKDGIIQDLPTNFQRKLHESLRRTWEDKQAGEPDVGD